jgi:hypothetical protein
VGSAAGLGKTVTPFDGGKQSKELARLSAEVLRLSEEAVNKSSFIYDRLQQFHHQAAQEGKSEKKADAAPVAPADRPRN